MQRTNVMKTVTVKRLTQTKKRKTMQTIAQKKRKIQKSKRREALIVRRVNGIVYTLDVWTASLRGLFTSGSPLLSSSSSSTSPDKETIAPGLDGHSYDLTSVGNTMDEKGVQIDVLPVSVMDVISSPVSTCTHFSPSSEEECSIVLGEKKTQIYAIDPYSGRVQWRQDPSGSRSFTKSQTSSKEKRSVLLQREDYVVGHVTAGGGDQMNYGMSLLVNLVRWILVQRLLLLVLVLLVVAIMMALAHLLLLLPPKSRKNSTSQNGSCKSSTSVSQDKRNQTTGGACKSRAETSLTCRADGARNSWVVDEEDRENHIL
mmetsp:Transcript_26630/g.39515  ORF Transcript_26630/g.39515 Transcript_26630/m.39515 type:complete len:315 (-) Transcript_26630:208-1152(-)